MSNIRKTFNFRDGVQVDDEVLVVKGDRVGVGTTSPDEDFDVRGNAKVIGIITANNLEISGVSTFTQVSIGSTISLDSTSGVITASSYKGDGSTLTGLPTSQWQNVSIVGAGASPIYVDGNVGIFTTDPDPNSLQVGGNPNASQQGVGFNSEGGVVASGVITATSFSGNVIGNVTGIYWYSIKCNFRNIGNSCNQCTGIDRHTRYNSQKYKFSRDRNYYHSWCDRLNSPNTQRS